MRKQQEMVKEGKNPSKFTKDWQSSLINPQQLKEESQMVIPPEILNNQAVLQIQAGLLDDASKSLEESLESIGKLNKEKRGDDKRIQALQITMNFNLAYCHEKLGKIGEASELYK